MTLEGKSDFKKQGLFPNSFTGFYFSHAIQFSRDFILKCVFNVYALQQHDLATMKSV